MREVELIVVGGGQAGLAAAGAAHAAGVQTLLVDENPLDLLSIRRNVPYWFGPRAARLVRRGDPVRWIEARSDLQALLDVGLDVHLGQSVWGVFPGPIVGLYDGERTELVACRAVILAAGRTDLCLAFPGWTLGGVMGGLGALRLLETYGYLDARRLLIVGATRVALEVARRAAAAGTEVVGMVDLDGSPRARWSHHTIVAAHGGAEVEAATLRPVAGGPDFAADAVSLRGVVDGSGDVTVEVDAVCVAIGQSPSIELAAAAGCALTFDGDSGAHTVVHEARLRTSQPGIFVAASAEEGKRAAGVAAAWVRSPTDWCASRPGDARVDTPRPNTLTAEPSATAARSTPSEAYPTRWQQLADEWTIDDDVCVCRCEEITRGELLAAYHQEGTVDPNELKRVSRAGMGLCQGRGCRSTIAGILANRAHLALDAIPLATYRPPVRPLPMRALATEERRPDEPREPIHAANFRLPTRPRV